MEMRASGSLCLECGAHAVRYSTDPISMETREGTYEVPGFEHEHCDACGEDLIPAEHIDPILEALVVLKRERLGFLSSADIHELRHSLGLRQSDLERQLGVSTGTVGRWERGEVLQSRMADKFMRLLGAHPELVEESGLVAREKRGPYRKRK